MQKIRIRSGENNKHSAEKETLIYQYMSNVAYANAQCMWYIIEYLLAYISIHESSIMIVEKYFYFRRRLKDKYQKVREF